MMLRLKRQESLLDLSKNDPVLSRTVQKTIQQKDVALKRMLRERDEAKQEVEHYKDLAKAAKWIMYSAIATIVIAVLSFASFRMDALKLTEFLN